jgi:hypothetical protein
MIRVAGAALVGGVLALVPASAALATPSSSVQVPAASDSWYRASVACGTPLGCPTTPSPYPAGTRHVGVQLGSEESRSYLQLDLSSVPDGARLTGGLLTVPLGGVEDGTASPDTAAVLACVAFDPVATADGTYTASPPEPSCSAASAPGRYVAAVGTSPAELVFDLKPVVPLWQTAIVRGVLVLLPQPGAAVTDTWHVAFSAASRTGGVAKPKAALQYDASVTPTPTSGFSPQPSVDVPVAQPTNPVLPGLGPVSAPQPLAPPAQPPAVATASPAVVDQPVDVVPVSVVLPRFRYPAVFLLPLLLAAVAVWLARALTREL